MTVPSSEAKDKKVERIKIFQFKDDFKWDLFFYQEL